MTTVTRCEPWAECLHQDPAPFTREQITAVATKLQRFFETLDTDERTILAALLLDWCGNPEAAHLVLWRALCLPPKDESVASRTK
ncbi:MAG: hypothetical protein AB7R89_13155 [Dehalococcoidia bacterium]